MILQPGVVLSDRYRLESRVGAGGMGEVWRAADQVLGRPVAVKVMLAGGESQRFLAEAKAMAGVRHPNVAAIHDYGRSGDVTYLVMEFVEGESLAQLLARLGRLSPAGAMRMAALAADGLQAVHDRGMVHRDIKPANLLIRPDGTVVITDFGIARAEDAAALTATGAVLGTPTYVSPEQVLGHPATPLSDVYSLGLTAYECVTGRKPFTGDNPYAIALGRLHGGPPPPGPEVPEAVRAVLDRALTADPDHRWPSAAALALAARAAADQQPSTPPPPQPLPPPPAGYAPRVVHPGPATTPPPPFAPAPAAAAPKRRTTRYAVLAGALVAVLAVGGIVFKLRDGSADAALPPPASSPVSAPPAADAVSPVDTQVREAGFVPCGDAYCPGEPMCWSGTVTIGGLAQPLRPLDCEGEHRWQTYAVLVLPPDAAGARTAGLAGRADVAATCTAAEMARRSVDSTRTKKWTRQPFPLRIERTDVWLVHCLATSPNFVIAGGPAFKAS